MSQLQVKKVVAVCFLEAAKLSLEHLGAYRLELSQQGVDGNAELPRVYGEVRRLRDYLQRCVSAYQEQVPLDMTATDNAMLVACCRRAVEDIDARLVAKALAPEEAQWLQRKRQVLIDWAVELAEKPLVELPLKPLCPVPSEAMRAMNTRLHQKARTGGKPTPKPPTGLAVGNAPTGLTGVMDRSLLTGVDPLLSASPAATRASQALPPSLFDAQRLADPRLRGMAVVDLHTYERLLAVPDYRLATVLLASLLEAAVIDHALARRIELDLTGSPDSWNLQEVLGKVMGEAALAKDKAVAYLLFHARNLLRPAIQMAAPAAVTQGSFERAREFVQRALYALGLGAGQPAPVTPVSEGLGGVVGVAASTAIGTLMANNPPPAPAPAAVPTTTPAEPV
jgi:hypothetical protein